jgi:UPF0755 protein
MVARFREVWEALPTERLAALRMTPLEVVTLASLIEREAAIPEERPLVSAVYHNRLRRGMLLQCDPTVIYALELAGRWDGNIRAADLKMDSPYNTYRHAGLPPGPIGNPGRASLEAALQPAPVDYLYFVSDTRGGHFFSRTLAEHNRNVRRHLHLREQRRNSARQSANKSPAPGAPPRASRGSSGPQ